MKTKLIFTFLLLFSLFLNGHAQKDIAKFFPAALVPSGGSDNIKNLVSGYITPIVEDYGQLANNGWYTTAAVHKQWGFDLSVTTNVITLKSGATTFSPPPLNGLTYLGGSKPLQTVYGKESEFPSFRYTSGPNAQTTFEGPDGANPSKDLPIGSLAIPTLQVGLGVFKNTDILIRFTPTITISNTETGSWGLALKHDLRQYISAWKELPFSLSLFAGYTRLKATTDLSGLYNGTNQNGSAKTNNYTVQLLVGKDLKILSLYAGIGYNRSSSTFAINGTYQLPSAQQQQEVPMVTLTDPFSEHYSSGGLRATAGLRLKLGPITLNGDYTRLSKQGIVTAGFGFTIR